MSDVQLWLSAAQVIGVAISVFVLLEMGAQRRTTYRPRLIFDNSVIWLKESTDDIPFASNKQEKMDYHFAMHDMALALRNIGLGTAHEVSIDWQYDLPAWKNLLLPEWNRYVERRDEPSPQYFYKPKDKDPKRRFGFAVKAPLEHHEDLSNVRPDVAVDVRLPDTILNTICFSMHSAIRANRKAQIIDKDFPPVEVVFKYRDIGNKRQRNIVEMRFHARAYTQRQPYLLFGFTEIDLKSKK